MIDENIELSEFSVTSVSIKRDAQTFKINYDELHSIEDIGEITIQKSETGYAYMNYKLFSIVESFLPHALKMNKQDPMTSGTIISIKIWDYEDPIVKLDYKARFSSEEPAKHSTSKVLLLDQYYEHSEEVKNLLIDLKTNLYMYLVKNELFTPPSTKVILDEKGTAKVTL